MQNCTKKNQRNSETVKGEPHYSGTTICQKTLEKAKSTILFIIY